MRITDEAIGEIFKDDLLADGAFTLKSLRTPTMEIVQRLIVEARQHRKEHYRFMQAADYKGTEAASDLSPDYWEEQAKTLLFRAKREQELANLLHIRISLNTHFGKKITAENVKAFITGRESR